MRSHFRSLRSTLCVKPLGCAALWPRTVGVWADVLSGDLYISLDTVRTNAELFGRPYDEELHRVLVHGVLHLVGINDKGPGEREIMEAAEDAALALR